VHSVKVALPDGMLAEGFDGVAPAHSFSSFVVGVTASKHLAFATESAAFASGTRGVASALTSMADSSTTP
jgi:hypothetical protein